MEKFGYVMLVTIISAAIGAFFDIILGIEFKSFWQRMIHDGVTAVSGFFLLYYVFIWKPSK